MKKELILLFLVLFLYGCSQSSKEFPFSYKWMDYSVSEPDETRGIDYVGFAFEGNYILLDQRINYDCCADISLYYKVDIKESKGNKEGILRIYEDNNNNSLCERTCTFIIKAKVKKKNIDEVELYGVKYKGWPYTFLSEKKR